MDTLNWILLALSVGLASFVIGLIFIQQKLRRQLKTEVQEKQQIISIISHDIKAPFNRVFALMHLITLDDNKLSETQKDYLGKVHQVIADGLGLMRNLVDYRNLLYRDQKIIPEKVNLGDLIQSLVKNMSSLAEKKQLKFCYSNSLSIELETDHIYLSRALENILANAIKFSPNGKTIHVALKESDNGHVGIHVKDDGPGFTQEDLGKLYMRFQKLSAQPTGGESSTGLGLFIARSMIQKISGKIQCVSSEGEGSTFIVTLPRPTQAMEL